MLPAGNCYRNKFAAFFIIVTTNRAPSVVHSKFLDCIIVFVDTMCAGGLAFLIVISYPRMHSTLVALRANFCPRHSDGSKEGKYHYGTKGKR